MITKVIKASVSNHFFIYLSNNSLITSGYNLYSASHECEFQSFQCYHQLTLALMDLFNDFTSVHTRIYPVNGHAALCNVSIPSVLNPMSSWKFWQVGWMNVDDSVFISRQWLAQRFSCSLLDKPGQSGVLPRVRQGPLRSLPCSQTP